MPPVLERALPTDLVAGRRQVAAPLDSGRMAVQLLLVAGLSMAAGAGWASLVDGAGGGVAIAIGALLPPTASGAVACVLRRAWPAVVAVPAQAILLLLAALAVAGDAGAVARVLSGGWSRLLTTTLPAQPGGDVEVLALVVSFLAAAVGSELVLRSRSPMGPAGPALVALVGTRMAAEGVGARLLGPAAAVAALTGVCALVRTGRRPALGVPLVAGAVLAAVVVGPALPWAEARPPFDPRSLRPVDPLAAATVSPLARVRGWQADPRRPLFSVRADGPTLLRLAVLDTYDGVRWSAAPTFVAAGAALPPPVVGDPEDGVPTRTIAAEVVIDGLAGPWVPLPPRPVRLTGPPVAVDPATAVVVAPAGLRPGLRFRVESRVPAPASAALALVGPAPAGPGLLALPASLPPEFGDLAREAAADASDPPITRLGKLQELFRTRFSESSDSAPGHSLARLSAFLDKADRVGSSEQLASCFVLLARLLGFPSRVAVGFRAAEATPALPVVLRGGDAHAWPEVALAGAGWVAFEPTPPRGQAQVSEPLETPAAAAAQAASASTVPPAPPADLSPPGEPGPARAPGWRPRLGLAVGLAGLIPVLASAAVAVAKRRRRATRRRAPDAATRVRGAWAEAVDRLVERGAPPAPGATVRTLAGAAEAVAPAACPLLLDLGTLADRAAFAGPGAVADQEAAQAWDVVGAAEVALDTGTPRLARLRWAVDPRPLLRRT